MSELVVLLHSHGLGGGQWRKLSGDLVERGYRVLAPDLAGQGTSEPWPEPKPFSFEIDVERVAALKPDHVIGHSYGGLIALHAARIAPVRTLSLFDPVAFGMLGKADSDARAILDALDLTWDIPERWLRTFVEFWSGAGSWDGLREEARAEFRRVAWVIHEGVRSLVADKTVFALDIPALLMTGEHSPLPAQRVVERLAKAMPRARHVVVPGVGHLGPVTQGRAVNAHIVDALAAGK
jgi:pimeloyl-ACP methyl ester carboxylesterase